MATTKLAIQLLGEFRVSVGGRTVAEGEWTLRKAKSLVKLLAHPPHHRLHCEHVIDRPARYIGRYHPGWLLCYSTCLTIMLAYGSPLFGQDWAQVMQWLQVILPVETLLLGSTVGFYFGNRR